MTRPLVAMRGIGKSFPGARVLDGVELDLRAGQVHVLLGANGAGKSTLMKILCGQLAPDAGTIELDGQLIRPHSPRDAERLGIICIHQELSLVRGMTVAENVFLGAEPTRLGHVDDAATIAASRELFARLGAAIDPRARVGSLSIAEQQLVEIARALRRRPRVLVMDEPTAALSEREVAALFEVVRGLASGGVAVVYISHRMSEIFAIGDVVTVLRDGRSIASRDLAGATVDDLIALMVGAALEDQVPAKRGAIGEEVLRLEEVSSPAIGPISLTVRAGEVLGLAGLVGAGRTEVLRAIFGADPITAGRVLVAGKPLRAGDPASAISAGVGLLTEDRKALGLVLTRSLAENLTLASVDQHARAGIIRLAGERAAARTFVDRLRIRATGVGQRVAELSGGNQQKVVLARWLARECRVLLLDEPTRGIDVAAKAEIYDLIRELTGTGVAVLLVTSEIPELLALSDRIAVMHRGRLAETFDRAGATQERVLAACLGHARAAG